MKVKDLRFTFTAVMPDQLVAQISDAKVLVREFTVQYGHDPLGWWCSSPVIARHRSGLSFYELVEEVQAEYDAARDDAESEALDELEHT